MNTIKRVKHGCLNPYFNGTLSDPKHQTASVDLTAS